MKFYQEIKDSIRHLTLDGIRQGITNWVVEHFSRISAETMGWIAVLMIHFATIPSLIAASGGLTDKMPPIDMVLFAWAGLGLLFARAAIMKDMLNIVTIGFGFMVQAVLMALMLFK
jgi:hypothetical protein